MSATKVDDEGRYQCLVPGCMKVFTRKHNLTTHNLTAHQNGSLIDCEFKWCGRTGDRGFAHRDYYLDHIREVHRREIPVRRGPKSLESRSRVSRYSEPLRHEPASRHARLDGLGVASSGYETDRTDIPQGVVIYKEPDSTDSDRVSDSLPQQESTILFSTSGKAEVGSDLIGIREASRKASCGGCWARKIRCSRTRPKCDACTQLQVPCTFQSDAGRSDSVVAAEAGAEQPESLVNYSNDGRVDPFLSDGSPQLADKIRERVSLPAGSRGQVQDSPRILLSNTEGVLAESDTRADDQTGATGIRDIPQTRVQEPDLEKKHIYKLDDSDRKSADLDEGLKVSPIYTASVDAIRREQTSFPIPIAPTTQAPFAPAKQLPQFEYASWKNFFHNPDSPTKGVFPRQNDEKWQLPYLQEVDLSKAQEESSPTFAEYSTGAKFHGQETLPYAFKDSSRTPTSARPSPTATKLGMEPLLSSSIKSDHRPKDDLIGESSTDRLASVVKRDTTRAQESITTLIMDDLRARIPTIPQGETDEYRILKEASSYIQFLQSTAGTREARDMAWLPTPESLLGHEELPSVLSHNTDSAIGIQARQDVAYNTLFPPTDSTSSDLPSPGLWPNFEDFALFQGQGDNLIPQSEKAITEPSQLRSLDGELTERPSSGCLQEESDSTENCTSVIVDDCGFNMRRGEVWKGSWNIYEASDVTLKDRLQLQAEKYTACEWNWWPLQSPRLRPRAGFLGLSYQCRGCTSTAHFEVPEEVARRLSPSQWLKDHIHETTDRPSGGSSTMTEQASGSVVPMSGSSSSSNTIQLRGRNGQPVNQPTSNQVSTSNPSKPPNPAPSSTNYSTFILLCYGSLPPKYRTIKVQNGFRDRLLMRGIQTHLRDMMGWFKFHFYWEGFGWCDFLEFRRLNKHYLEKLRPGVPEARDEAYVFDPRPPKHNPPISRQGWRMRYYHCKCVEGNDRTVRQIPKRKLAFFDALEDDDEVLYGLDIQLQPLLWRVLAWQAVILTGPLAFWIYWLATHDGDWQNATALMLVTIALMESCFLIPLNGHFRN